MDHDRTGDLITRKALADMAGVHVLTVDRWHASSVGPPRLQVGRWVRYRLKDVTRWLDELAEGVRVTTDEDRAGPPHLEQVREVVATWPPLSPAQRAQLADLLRPAPNGARRGRGGAADAQTGSGAQDGDPEHRIDQPPRSHRSSPRYLRPALSRR